MMKKNLSTTWLMSQNYVLLSLPPDKGRKKHKSDTLYLNTYLWTGINQKIIDTVVSSPSLKVNFTVETKKL